MEIIQLEAMQRKISIGPRPLKRVNRGGRRRKRKRKNKSVRE
jgi:hypothetical protein